MHDDVIAARFSITLVGPRRIHPQVELQAITPLHTRLIRTALHSPGRMRGNGRSPRDAIVKGLRAPALRLESAEEKVAAAAMRAGEEVPKELMVTASTIVEESGHGLACACMIAI
jgi:hypothetical protein